MMKFFFIILFFLKYWIVTSNAFCVLTVGQAAKIKSLHCLSLAHRKQIGLHAPVIPKAITLAKHALVAL